MEVLRSARSGAVLDATAAMDPARLEMLEAEHALRRPTFTYSEIVVSGALGE
jgi:hypothetical protein